MDEATSVRKHPAALILRIVLLVVLFVLLAAFAYDYLYARREPSLLIEKLDQLASQAKEGDEPITNEDIKVMAGFEPQDSKEVGPRSLQEIYIWQGGLIVTSHKLYVMYEKGDDDRWEYEECRLGEDPARG